MQPKKLIAITLCSLLALACKKEVKKLNISGNILNKNSDSVVILNSSRKFSRTIPVNENGNFKDTINIKDGFYLIFDGKEYARLYLENGKNINITLNTKQFDETINFTGDGASESNFLARLALDEEAFVTNNDFFALEIEDFKLKADEFIANYKNRLSDKNLSENFKISQEKKLGRLNKYLIQLYNDKNYEKIKLAKGQVAPNFDFENFDGGTTSLEDLKGKYVFIDIWATWCSPCKYEIPFIQKLEKKYEGKITFVSISIDGKRGYEAWKNYVYEKNLTGVQLFTQEKKKEFMNDYRINAIPRFFLIDPEGKIVTVKAPRPSDTKEITELFDSL